MDIPDLYVRAQDSFGERVHQISGDQWGAATPCADWDVRALVNHLVGEILWVVPLFEGATIADVGTRLDGDLLGDDPIEAWDAGAPPAAAAVREPGAMERIVHLSFGDAPGSEYLLSLIADLLVHGWDLARATGQDDTMDPELVEVCASWFTGMAAGYRAAGAVADRPVIKDNADHQTRLLAEFGRSTAP